MAEWIFSRSLLLRSSACPLSVTETFQQDDVSAGILPTRPGVEAAVTALDAGQTCALIVESSTG